MKLFTVVTSVKLHILVLCWSMLSFVGNSDFERTELYGHHYNAKHYSDFLLHRVFCGVSTCVGDL